MYGLFFNNGCAVATGIALLVPFFSSLLQNESLSVQLRLSALAMIVYGLGATFGGQILGIVNDKFGGPRAVGRANMILLTITYGSLFVCNEMQQFNFLCFWSSFWIGTGDSSQMT